MKHILLVILVATLAAGCKKKHYSSNCGKAVDLVAPWSTFALPTGEGHGRVCSSTDLKTEIEHLSGSEADWVTKYEAALVAQGYTKDKCSSLSCSYVKAGDKIKLRANQVATGKRAKTHVHLERTAAK